MHRLLLALAFSAIAVPALAGGLTGGIGGGNDIGEQMTTSMGEPSASPGFAAPRSAAIPGTPANAHALALGQDPALVARCGTWHPKPWCHAPYP